MTRDGLVERGAASGEETRISHREQEIDLRQARDVPLTEAPPGRAPDARPEGSRHSHRPGAVEPSGMEPAASPTERAGPADAPIQEAPASPAEHAVPREARPERLRFESEQPGDTNAGQPGRQASRQQHGAKYQQRFAEEAAKTGAQDGEGAAKEARHASKLEFTADELPPDPPGKKLTNARRKAERSAEKLEAAKQKLPARRKLRLETESDPETGKASKHLKFEKEVKSQRAHVRGPLPLLPVKKGANLAVGYAHKKLYQVEDENVGTKAGHHTEMVAEGGLRTLYHRHKTAPYRKVSRLQEKATKTSARAAYQQALHDNPNLKSNLLSRMWQKRKIKRQYAKAAREAKRAGQAVKKTAVTTEKIATHVVLFVKRHPLVFGILALILLLFFLITSVFSSCSNMGISGMGGVLASSYLAEDKDIDDAELDYTEWETDLQMAINQAEADHPGYDEYRYKVDEIGHDPYELMGFLTSVYQNFTYSQVQAILRQIFEEQYILEFVEVVEIRYRTETHTDPDTGEEYEVEVPYEWHILNVNLSARSFGKLIVARMSADQREICEILLETKGNRQYVANVFGDVNWLPNVTSYYGYRMHPISGGKDFHKAVDIGMAQGTEILAGHDGVVTQAGDAGDYGLFVVLEGEISGSHTLTTKYAHSAQVLVSPGQEVKKGDVIAKVGSTGNSTGPHLHLEVLVDGQYLNPLYFADTGDTSGHSLPTGATGGGNYTDYEIPPEALADKQFAAMIAEAEKYLGYPYVWGGASPETSFDCSGFVSWVINHCGVGWDYGRLGSDPLYFDVCTPISPSEAKPGDLIFFQKTYDTDNTSHVGIYVGNGMMIHCGDPISYTSINTKYWQEHFYGFGRLPNPAG